MKSMKRISQIAMKITPDPVAVVKIAILTTKMRIQLPIRKQVLVKIEAKY